MKNGNKKVYASMVFDDPINNSGNLLINQSIVSSTIDHEVAKVKSPVEMSERNYRSSPVNEFKLRPVESND